MPYLKYLSDIVFSKICFDNGRSI